MNLTATRRAFLGATAASYARISGANERVRLGVIGCGLIAGQHISDFKQLPGAELAAFSDTYAPRIAWAQQQAGGGKAYADFRRLLDDQTLAAVVVATPDHWHALMTMMACAAGKDVYVEKPMTLFVREGRWMSQVARRHKRIVQVGTQQRSGKHYQQARDLVRAGRLGKVLSIRYGGYRNIMPGFGKTTPAAPPAELNYDLWLGPAPKKPYTLHRSLYHFRWFWDYSGGQMTNLGAHDLDLVHWIMDVAGPKSVCSIGGRYALEDDGETPDLQDALFDYGAFTMNLSLREAAAGRRGAGGFEICGTQGTMTLSRSGFEIVSDQKIHPANAIPDWSRPPGHPERATGPSSPWTEAARGMGSSDEQMLLHKRNFLDCIKSRQEPIAPVEGGHGVSVACHLANISLQTGRRIYWDAAKEEIVGDRAASALLERPYREPWDKVLRSLLA